MSGFRGAMLVAKKLKKNKKNKKTKEFFENPRQTLKKRILKNIPWTANTMQTPVAKT
jgi:hypothetical protein